jgi:molecular chaperone DnaK (HSP70)
MWQEHLPDRLLLVGGSSRLPLLRSKLAAQVAEPSHLGLYPDEVVALGAGIHGARGAGRLLIDVLSRDLGVESSWGQMIPLLFQGTPLPCGSAKKFESSRGGTLEIGVLQGGEGNLQEKLGTIQVEHVDSQEEVEVLFEVDSEGLLQVEVRRQDGSVAIHEILGLSGQEGEKGSSRNFGDSRYRNMEKRCAKISVHLNEDQQQRMQRLLDRLRVLRSHRDAWEAGLREMEVFLARLEEVARS